MYSFVLDIHGLISLIFQGKLQGTLDDVFGFEDVFYAASIHSSGIADRGIHPQASGLYFISSPHSDKVYVGSTSNLSRRKSQHYHDLEKSHENPGLWGLSQKHGRDGFRFTSLELYADRETLYRVEQALYDKLLECEMILNTGLDVKAAWKGRTIPEEARAKMALAKIGTTGHENQRKAMDKLWDNDEFKDRMRQGARERMNDPEFKERLRQANLGRPLSEGHRKKISEGGKGALRSNSRKISVNGVIYDSLSRAVTATGFPESNLRNWAKNQKPKYSHVFWVE